MEEKIFTNVAHLIGKTPLIELVNYEKNHALEARLIAKLESQNPAGSAKDRVAYAILSDLKEKGQLTSETVLIEPTSGNTGVALCALAASLGIRTIIVMPSTMSKERRLLMKAYGAELVLTDGALGMQGAIDKAEALAREIPHAVIAGQFVNPANPLAHKQTTGPEIWEDTAGAVDIFVAGVGTGGTISGVGSYLKERNPQIQIIAVEPEKSAVLSGKNAGPHGLMGIGAGFVPETLNTSIYDEVVTVSEEQAYQASRELASKEGLLVGISSGAALAAAEEVAKRKENKGKMIVVLLPDTGERYLSTPLFDEEA